MAAQLQPRHCGYFFVAQEPESIKPADGAVFIVAISKRTIVSMTRQTNEDRARELVEKAEAGSAQSLGMAFEVYRDQLRRAIRLRVNSRLKAREDESDILQEAFLAAAKDLSRYAKEKPVSVYVWFRGHVQQRLLAAHRKHLDCQKRDARREVGIYRNNLGPGVDSLSIAGQLVGSLTSPSQSVSKAERREILRQILDDMDPLDREIVALRHFESLKSIEIASLLDIKESTASTRYLRALKKIRDGLLAHGITNND